MIPSNFIKNNLQAGGNNATSAVEGIKQRIVEQFLLPSYRKTKNDQPAVEQTTSNDKEDDADDSKANGSLHSLNEPAADRLMPGQLIKNVLIKFNNVVIRETNFLMDVFNFSQVDASNLLTWQDSLFNARSCTWDSKTQKTMVYFIFK